jgi:hypothetical protein
MVDGLAIFGGFAQLVVLLAVVLAVAVRRRNRDRDPRSR